MLLNCRQCASTFEITDHHLRSYEKVAPVINGARFALPPPTLCPLCRQQRRLSFRNERNLYRSVSALSGAPVITAYAPESPYKSYLHPEYFGDGWNPLDYGRDFDFTRPFFEQLAELWREVPHLALTTSVDAAENNCPYVNFAGNNKNAHMVFDSDFVEDSYYSNVLKHSKHCMDCTFVDSSELCYECVDCSGCYELLFSQDCASCRQSYFLKNCIGCSNCFMCSNITRKQYCIRNQQLTAEEYAHAFKKLNLGSRSALAKFHVEFDEFCLNYHQKYSHNLRIENSSGDYITSSKNCDRCFNIGDGEDLMYCDSLYHGAKDCIDVSSFGEKIERVYESGTIGVNCYNTYFAFIVVATCSDIYYSSEIRATQHCFGCVSLRRNSYCLLNKQYAPSDYFQMVTRVIAHMRDTGEWGEYFPATLSPFAYNETVAHEYYPLDEMLARGLGYRWRAQDAKNYIPVSVTLPDSATEQREEVLNQLLACTGCRKNYKIIVQELRFTAKLSLPLSVLCHDCRHKRRMARRNPMLLWERNCASCSAAVMSSYAPSRRVRILCERCYQEDIA